MHWTRSPSRRGALLAVLAAFAGCATGGGFVTPTSSDRFFVAGYHPYWAGDGWRDYPIDVLTELYFFELEVDASGGFFDRHGWPTEWRAMVDSAFAGGVQVTPTVAMHDAEAFTALFSDAEARAHLVESVASLLAATPGMAGIHLDFEVFQPVEADVRDGFTSFVRELRRRMREIDAAVSLSIFTLAFDVDDVYDEPALAELADYLVVQGYDYHSAGSAEAGPLGAVDGWGELDWTSVVERFRGLGVPSRKIVMSVPLYGYEWPVVGGQAGAATRGPGVTIPLTAARDVLPELPRAFDRVAEHGSERDPATGSPYYTFQGPDGWYQGWYEDRASLRAKYDFVRSQGLGGVALFPLAYGTDELWSDLRSAFARSRREP